MAEGAIEAKSHVQKWVLSKGGIALTILSILALVASIAGDGAVTLLKLYIPAWTLIALHFGPTIALLSSALAVLLHAYGFLQILTKKESFNLAEEARNGVAETTKHIVAVAQKDFRLGCMSALTFVTLLVVLTVSLVLSFETSAPPSLRFIALTEPGIVVHLTEATQTCRFDYDNLSFPILLDNSQGAVTVTWQVIITEVVPGSAAIWATALPASGAVAPGQRAVITLTTSSLACDSFVLAAISGQGFIKPLLASNGHTYHAQLRLMGKSSETRDIAATVLQSNSTGTAPVPTPTPSSGIASAAPTTQPLPATSTPNVPQAGQTATPSLLPTATFTPTPTATPVPALIPSNITILNAPLNLGICGKPFPSGNPDVPYPLLHFINSGGKAMSWTIYYPNYISVTLYYTKSGTLPPGTDQYLAFAGSNASVPIDGMYINWGDYPYESHTTIINTSCVP